MNADIQTLASIGICLMVLIGFTWFSFGFKTKRVVNQSRILLADINNKNVEKFIRFLKRYSMVYTPPALQMLSVVQKTVSEHPEIDGKLKLALYQILKRKRVGGLIPIRPIYVEKSVKGN